MAPVRAWAYCRCHCYSSLERAQACHPAKSRVVTGDINAGPSTCRRAGLPNEHCPERAQAAPGALVGRVVVAQAPPSPSCVGLDKGTCLQPRLGTRSANSCPAGLTGLTSYCKKYTGQFGEKLYKCKAGGHWAAPPPFHDHSVRIQLRFCLHQLAFSQHSTCHHTHPLLADGTAALLAAPTALGTQLCLCLYTLSHTQKSLINNRVSRTPHAE